MKTFTNHPLAELFPLYSKDRLEALADDITANGLSDPIVLLDGMILDGRNRLAACEMAGIDPIFIHYKGKSPKAFVITKNIQRRDLTPSQRALIAAQMECFDHGGARVQDATRHLENMTRKEAAKAMRVSQRSIARAKKVIDEASKKDVKAVEKGEKTVTEVLKENAKKEEKPKPPEEKLDKANGRPVPDSILEDWNKAEEVKKLMTSLSDIRCTVKKAIDEGEVGYKELTNTAMADFNNAYSSLKQVVPFSVCPTCSGHSSKKCSLCLGKGFLSEFRYKQCVPKETKEVLAKLYAKK